MITEEKHYTAALYCRLSQDDGNTSESVSIGTQKSLLTRYCTENGFWTGMVLHKRVKSGIICIR